MCMVGLLVGCEGNEDTVDDGNSLNWSLFRGDASLSGYTDRSLPKKPSLLWSYKSGVRTVSSPIVPSKDYLLDVTRKVIYGGLT